MAARKGENGKSNIRYDNARATLNSASHEKDIECRTLRNNTAVTGNSHKCPPRMTWSVDADGNSEISESSINFVNNRHKKRTLGCNKCSLKYFLWTLLFIFAVIIASITSLYILERRKVVRYSQFVERKYPCFNRASAKQIKNLTQQPEILTAINESRQLLMEKMKNDMFQFHAVSLSVSYMGQMIWSFNHGTKNFNGPSASITNDTPYPIASVSKVFTVIMLQKLIADRSIGSIDDYVNAYVPSLNVINPFGEKKITFRHLACMMAGLPREAPCYPPKLNLSSNMLSKIGIMCPFTSSAMIERLRKVSLILPPGLRPSYSNLGVGLLGDVLARITNISVENWVEENIIKPLNLTNTGYISADRSIRKHGFPLTSLVGGMEAPVMDWGWLRSAAGMYSSINDMGKLGSFFLSGANGILNKTIIENLLQTAYIWSDGSAQGCPFEMQPIRFHDDSINYMSYDKSGYTFGYGSIFRLIPAMKLNLNFLVASSFEKAVYICKEIVNTKFVKAFDKLLKRDVPKYDLPPKAEAYVGTYKLSTYWPLIQKPCKVTLEDGMLILQIEWMMIPLSYHREWTLKTGSFGRYQYSCPFFSSGLINERYVFTPPDKNQTHSPGFYVNGISSAGYIKFDRVYD